MRALILNSGMGKRMGVLTSEHPKCMTDIGRGDTILSRQLRLLNEYRFNEVIITTGMFDDILVKYCNSLNLPMKYIFVKNPIYYKTNYIYSIFLAENYLNDDIILMHGDLVFESSVLHKILSNHNSCMTVSSTVPLPEKDFKAVIKNGVINKIGVDFFDDAVTAQPLYKLNKKDWLLWLGSIINYCKAGKVSYYAENAFNEISNECHIYPVDFKDKLCAEVDTPEDLELVKKILQ